MKKYLSLATVMLSLFVLAKTASAETFTAYLNAAQQVPTNASTGTGVATVTLNAAATQVTVNLTYSGLSSNATSGFIRGPAAVGVNAGILFNLNNVSGTSGTLSQTFNVSPSNVVLLRAQLLYINIHTVNNISGEIRGQLKRRAVSVNDFDGDGRTDFSVLRYPEVEPPAVAQIIYYNLRSTNGAIGVFFGDANTDYPTPGDYDGDGKDDIALYREGTTPSAASFFLMLRSSTNTFQSFQWGISGDEPVARDYDGDGITDIAVFRRGANTGDPAFWYIRQSSSGALRAFQWGTTGGFINGDTPVPGDYDGDGKFDVAVYRYGQFPPTDVFLILRSSDGALDFRVWGNFSTDYIAPGDFDGDGKTDYVAARTGELSTDPMVWYILRSSDGTLDARWFGISSDVPAQADYDGDGRTDLAIYRAGENADSQSTFFYLSSLNNTIRRIDWGLGSDFAVNTFDVR